MNRRELLFGAAAAAVGAKAIAADPTDSRALFKLANLADLAGDEDEAIALYERAIALRRGR